MKMNLRAATRLALGASRGLPTGVVIGVALSASAAAPDLDKITSQSMVMAFLIVLGAQVLIVVGVASKVQRIVFTMVDARLKDDDSPLGIHRLDAYAHEPMRRVMVKEIVDGLAGIREEMRTLNRDHREEMSAITELVKPVIQNNRFAMEYMAAQTRRQPATLGTKKEE